MDLKVTFISDTHCKHNRMPVLPGGDILIFSGDAMSSGYYPAELDGFLEWIQKQDYRYKVCIAGNHDRYCETLPSYMTKDVFERYYEQGVRYLHNECIDIEGLKIYGTPYQPYFCNWAFNISDSEELYNIYKLIPKDIDILITHTPPFDILDKSHLSRPQFGMTGEEPLGSKELKQVLDELGEHAPRYHAFGHIHGDGGKTVVTDRTIYINGSVCDEAYKPANEPITLDIEVKA